MIEALTIDAASTIRLLQSIEALYPMLALIHVFLDNARYHPPKLVQEWLALPDDASSCTSSRASGWTPTRSNGYGASCTETSLTTSATQLAPSSPMRNVQLLREKFRNWADLCDFVTDNFRVINPKDFRVMT